MQIQLRRMDELEDWRRPYRIYLNGQKIGVINRGETIGIECPDEECEMILKIDWCSSNKISFDPRVSKRFACGNNSGLLNMVKALFYVLFKPSQYLWLKEDEGETAEKGKE